jgi:hypothetical protein
MDLVIVMRRKPLWRSYSRELDEKSIDSQKYQNPQYLHQGRWASYREVICEVIRINPSNILEIGPGNNIVSSILQTLGFNIFTLDINPTINPDIVGSVTAMPIKSSAIDLIIAQQILEHLPFNRFAEIISDFSRISNIAIISIPHVSFHLTIGIKLPLLSWHDVCITAPITIGKTSKEHYWEIGPSVKVEKVQYCFKEAGFEIERNFRTPEHPYYHFFILRKPSIDPQQSKLCV